MDQASWRRQSVARTPCLGSWGPQSRGTSLFSRPYQRLLSKGGMSPAEVARGCRTASLSPPAEVVDAYLLRREGSAKVFRYGDNAPATARRHDVAGSSDSTDLAERQGSLEAQELGDQLGLLLDPLLKTSRETPEARASALPPIALRKGYSASPRMPGSRRAKPAAGWRGHGRDD